MYSTRDQKGVYPPRRAIRNAVASTVAAHRPRGVALMRWFWLDRFTEFVAGTRATALKSVTLSEDYLHDHWESYPLMPNTLIAEGMAQAGGLLVSEVYRFNEL